MKLLFEIGGANMTANTILLLEVAREKGVDPKTLQSMIDTVNQRYSVIKQKSKVIKIDFVKMVEEVCAEYTHTGLFEKPAYESAVKSYTAKNKSQKSKLRLEIWRSEPGRLRVRVGLHSSHEFAVGHWGHWLNEKWVKTPTLSYLSTVTEVGAKRECTIVSVKEAQKKGLLWLKAEERKPKAVR